MKFLKTPTNRCFWSSYCFFHFTDYLTFNLCLLIVMIIIMIFLQMPLSPNTFVNVLKEIIFCKNFYTKEKWCRKFLVLLSFLESGNKVSGCKFCIPDLISTPANDGDQYSYRDTISKRLSTKAEQQVLKPLESYHIVFRRK